MMHFVSPKQLCRDGNPNTIYEIKFENKKPAGAFLARFLKNRDVLHLVGFALKLQGFKYGCTFSPKISMTPSDETTRWIQKKLQRCKNDTVSSITTPSVVGLGLRAPPAMGKKFDIYGRP